MSELRKRGLFRYVLPVFVVLFLFFIIGPVIAEYLPNVYIGSISSYKYPDGYGNMTIDHEDMLLKLYNDSNLTNYRGSYYIQGNSQYGFPTALGLAAISAQAHRTKVNISTYTNISISSIEQAEKPDDIFRQVEEVKNEVGVVQDTADGIYSQALGISGQVNGVDGHLGNQDITLEKILKAVTRRPTGTTPGGNQK